jgi:hypothetical protein
MQMDVQIRRNTEGISNPETPNALGNLLQMMARVAHLASTSTIAVSDERYRHGYLHGKLGRKKRRKPLFFGTRVDVRSKKFTRARKDAIMLKLIPLHMKQEAARDDRAFPHD